jgi:hypothetical protein
MGNLEEFRRTMVVRGREFEERATKTVNKFCAVLHQTLVLATPVDTGRARANWDVSISGESEAPSENTDRSGAATIRKGREITETRKREEDTIHVVNNVPYLPELNRGSSAQAPAMFVESSISAVVAAFKGKRL